VPVPVRLPATVRIRALSAGTFTSMALSTTGQVWTWGDNELGQLGNGSTADHSARPGPVRLPAGTTVRQISSGDLTDLVLTARGTILTWGGNGEGQLGIGKVSRSSRVPVAVHLPGGQAALSVFGGGITENTLAVTRSRR
jgi:alpha-tubulin suppressor-like RCC1 family protein